MAERKQVDEIYSMTRLRHQKTPVAALNKINMGVGAVLRCLDEAQGKRLTAGELSRQLGVSSARIAVILNKMSSEKLVIKSRENSDARVVVVELTALGEQMAQDIMTKMKELIEKLSNGKQPARLGVRGTDVTKEINKENGIPIGAYVKSIDMDSPAMNAGIQGGDVITKIGTQSIETFEDLTNALMKLQPEDETVVTVKRYAHKEYIEMTFEVTLDQAD